MFPQKNLACEGLTWIPAWIGNYIQYEVWDEITYLFPSFGDAAL